jgi:hypothetical protein
MGLMCANPACTRGVRPKPSPRSVPHPRPDAQKEPTFKSQTDPNENNQNNQNNQPPRLHLRRQDTPTWRKGWTRPNETEPVSLCNACEILFKPGWFCVHCEEVYRKLEGADDDAAGPAGPWIGCDFCERWSHVSCELAHAPDALASTFPAATSTADLSAAAAEQPPRQEDNAEIVIEMKPPAPSPPDPRVSLFNADGAAMSSTPYRCPECRGKPDDAYLPPPRALASHASQTSLAAGAHVLDGRVVHNRPFLRAGDKRTTGGGGGGGQGGRAAAARPNADGAAPKGKRSRGGSSEPPEMIDRPHDEAVESVAEHLRETISRFIQAISQKKLDDALEIIRPFCHVRSPTDGPGLFVVEPQPRGYGLSEPQQKVLEYIQLDAKRTNT